MWVGGWVGWCDVARVRVYVCVCVCKQSLDQCLEHVLDLRYQLFSDNSGMSLEFVQSVLWWWQERS